MIICLSGFVIAGSAPSSMSACARNDMSGALGPCGGAAYSPHHHQLLQQFAPVPLLAHRGLGAARCSSSSESVSSHGASPPPPPPAPCPGPGPGAALPGAAMRGTRRRVRTLYACLGESEGELSFEPNQIITNVCPSGEPGWLRGSLNGKSGLVPENYVEPLP